MFVGPCCVAGKVTLCDSLQRHTLLVTRLPPPLQRRNCVESVLEEEGFEPFFTISFHFSNTFHFHSPTLPPNNYNPRLFFLHPPISLCVSPYSLTLSLLCFYTTHSITHSTIHSTTIPSTTTHSTTTHSTTITTTTTTTTITPTTTT